MMGFGITETCRDEMTMTVFCPEVSARPTMSVPRPRRVCSRPGQGCWSTSPWLAIAGEGMLDDAFPLPFPAAQPASALAGRREDVYARPDFGRRAALEMLMGPEVIVEASRVGQGQIQRPGVLDGVPEEQPFDGPDQAFDAAVLPGASGIAVLLANPHAPQGQAKAPRREHRFVIGAQKLRAAIVTTGRGEMVPNRQRRLFRHSLHAQTGATGMVHDRQTKMRLSALIRLG